MASKNETVMANPPLPRLSRESQRWVLQKYSFGYEHITKEWVDAMMRVVALPKYQEAVRKMEEAGLRVTRFLPHLESVALSFCLGELLPTIRRNPQKGDE